MQVSMNTICTGRLEPNLSPFHVCGTIHAAFLEGESGCPGAPQAVCMLQSSQRQMYSHRILYLCCREDTDANVMEGEYEWVREYLYDVRQDEEKRTYVLRETPDYMGYVDLNTRLMVHKRGKRLKSEIGLQAQEFPRPAKVCSLMPLLPSTVQAASLWPLGAVWQHELCSCPASTGHGYHLSVQFATDCTAPLPLPRLFSEGRLETDRGYRVCLCRSAATASDKP